MPTMEPQARTLSSELDALERKDSEAERLLDRLAALAPAIWNLMSLAKENELQSELESVLNELNERRWLKENRDALEEEEQLENCTPAADGQLNAPTPACAATPRHIGRAPAEFESGTYMHASLCNASSSRMHSMVAAPTQSSCESSRHAAKEGVCVFLTATACGAASPRIERPNARPATACARTAAAGAPQCASARRAAEGVPLNASLARLAQAPLVATHTQRIEFPSRPKTSARCAPVVADSDAEAGERRARSAGQRRRTQRREMHNGSPPLDRAVSPPRLLGAMPSTYLCQLTSSGLASSSCERHSQMHARPLTGSPRRSSARNAGLVPIRSWSAQPVRDAAAVRRAVEQQLAHALLAGSSEGVVVGLTTKAPPNAGSCGAIARPSA